MNDWEDMRVPNGAGFLDRHCGPVGDALAANFDDGAELGASFAAVLDGELIVDIRGGHADRAKERPWREDTLACIYSTGKAVLTLLVAQAVTRGQLDYDAPVAAYWPEFAGNGKAAITVAQALSHQAGLCGIPDEMSPQDWLDWQAITDRLAAMAPLWTPGTANGYHPQTFGFIAGEILRRVTERSVGELISDFNAAHDVQIYCGLSDSEIARVAFMPKPPKAPDLGELTKLKEIAFLKRWSAAGRVKPEDWMRAEIPASNMHADARSLALFLQPFVNGGALNGTSILSQASIDDALCERCRGDDLVLPFHLSWSAGLMRNINGHFGPNPNAFGHAGFGGSCVVIDPARNLTAAYIMNKMSPYLVGDPRALRLINALYEGLDA